MNYESLLKEAENNDIYIIEKAKFESHSAGLIHNDVIGLNKNISTNTERACVLAEELGHYHTTYGNIIDQNDVSNRKQERKARLWAYNKMIGLTGIIDAYKHDCSNLYEIIEYLGVTEEFFKDAIECYKQKYGAYTEVDNYIIYFEPYLSVMEFVK